LPIDVQQLRIMTSADPGLAAEILGVFREQAGIWSRLLDPNGPREQWSDACHTIKGSARSIGAFALADACEAAERLGRSGEASPVRASTVLSSVRDRLGETIEEVAVLEHWLALGRGFPEA